MIIALVGSGALGTTACLQIKTLVPITCFKPSKIEKIDDSQEASMSSNLSSIEHEGHRHIHHEREEETSFAQTNLVSDGFVSAPTIDPNLINPWGVAFSPTGPFWVADNGKGVATIYDGAENPKSVAGFSAITIAVPKGQPMPPAGSTSPTGGVFNPTG